MLGVIHLAWVSPWLGLHWRAWQVPRLRPEMKNLLSNHPQPQEVLSHSFGLLFIFTTVKLG